MKKILVWTGIALVILQILDSMFTNKKKGMYKYDGSLSASDKIQRWIDYFTPIIKPIAKEYGLPWKALVAQTGWETGWGKSSLIYDAFNFAGIKAVKGEPYVTRRTHEIENGVKIYKDAKFRKWANLEDGLSGYANFFHKNKRYAKALEFPNDPYRFIEEIRKAGYATSLNYVKNLHGILDKYLS